MWVFYEGDGCFNWKWVAYLFLSLDSSVMELAVAESENYIYCHSQR
jgi:hypothetical protein